MSAIEVARQMIGVAVLHPVLFHFNPHTFCPSAS